MTTRRGQVLLGAYAAKTCPRATHNLFDVTVPRIGWTPDPATQERMDAGRTFEDEVVEGLLQVQPSAVDLRQHDESQALHISETLRHLWAGTRLIIGGRLPDDVTGGRTGKPDLLIRAEDRADGRPGYHVGDIKHHLTLARSPGATALVSLPEAPERDAAVRRNDVALRTGDREDDCLQLAHYWRMLDAAGFAAASPWGAVLGTDGPHGYVPDAVVLSWYDLSEPLFSTFSRSSGKALRSALERYDHEHAFRLDVARIARTRTGAEDDPEPLVLPIGHDECDGCEWASVCVDTLPDDDLSKELRADLSIREYLALRTAGIETVAGLASADVDELFTDAYEQETAHLRTRRTRLHKAQLNAELAQAGVVIRLREGAPAIPMADVEYDVDCEWSPEGHVYLWGVLRSEVGVSTYTPFLDLAVVDDETEFALLSRFLRWLDRQISADGSAGRSTAVFYYSHAEQTQIRRVTAAVGRPLPALCAEAAPDAWIDLLPYVKQSVDSRWGLGLKIVAVYGAEFEWRDDDPGGLQSQLWYEQAVTGNPAAETRLLAYNEDDVRATAGLRAWLSQSEQ